MVVKVAFPSGVHKVGGLFAGVKIFPCDVRNGGING